MAIMEKTDMLIRMTDMMIGMMIDIMGKMIGMTGVTSGPDVVPGTMRAAEVTEATAVEITGTDDAMQPAAAVLCHELFGRACALTSANTLLSTLFCCIGTLMFHQVLLACGSCLSRLPIAPDTTAVLSPPVHCAPTAGTKLMTSRATFDLQHIASGVAKTVSQTVSQS